MKKSEIVAIIKASINGGEDEMIHLLATYHDASAADRRFFDAVSRYYIGYSVLDIFRELEYRLAVYDEAEAC